MKKRRLLICGFLLFTGLFFMFLSMNGHDAVFHAYRISMMASEIKNHPFNIPIRMLSESMNGYGYGAALYYGDIFFYLPALLVRFGLSVKLVYRLLIGFIWFGTALSAFSSSRYIGRENADFSLLFTFVYLFTPPFIYNLTIRSALGEALAMMLLPLIFFSFYGILKNYNIINEAIFTLSMSLLLLTHNIAFILTVFFLALLSLYEYKNIFQRKTFFSLFRSAIMTFLLTLSYTIPMLEQMRYQAVHISFDSVYQKKSFTQKTLLLIYYFLPHELVTRLADTFHWNWDLHRWKPGTVIWILIPIIFVFIIHRHKISRSYKHLLVLILVLIISIGNTPIIHIYKNILYPMQFPWRFLPFIALGCSFLSAALFDLLQENKVFYSSLIISLTVIIAFLSCFSYIRDYLRSNQKGNWLVYNANGADDLYLPLETGEYDYENRGVIIESNHSNILSDFYRDKGTLYVSVNQNTYDDTHLIVPLHMYKGYAAYFENGQKIPVSKSDTGLVVLHIKDYNGKLYIYYKGTLCQKICDIISALAVLFYAIYIYSSPIKKLLLHHVKPRKHR